MRQELRQAGIGDMLVAALLVSAFYTAPLVEGKLWIASLLLTCGAGGVAILREPGAIRAVPPLLVAFVAVYAAAGLYHPESLSASGVGRYVVRPVAIAALALWLMRPDTRRRALLIVVIVVAPQVVVAAAQSLDAVIELGPNAAAAADSVTGTLGDSEANTLGLAAIAAAVLSGSLMLAGVVRWPVALAGASAFLAVCVLASTRAAVVLVPLAALGLVAGGLGALGRRAPVRALAGCAAVAVVSVPAIYGATQAVYPGSFTGAFSNQGQELLGDGGPLPDADAKPPAGEEGKPYEGPRGVGVLPGRREQLRLAADISGDDGVGTALLGRGFDSAAVLEDAVVGSAVPLPHRTGVTWGGKVITETGWLGLLAFLALLGWLFWLGIRLIRTRSDPWDRALGWLMTGFVALTAGGAIYTTVLDVRAYSALFIVLAAATIAATRRPPPAIAEPSAAARPPERARVGARVA